MATKAAHKRLVREYQNITENPPPYIIAHPSEANILEWHYILTGPPDTPYAGGQYWGTLVFPPDYPFAPPAIRMHTPNGRFQPSTRLCLSISDFHPKSFNPAWSVSTILIGLMSFMNGEEMTAGSISGTPEQRKWYAARSRWWNSTGGGLTVSGFHAASQEVGNIKTGDRSIKFRTEWVLEDFDNWNWMQDNRIDAKTGQVLPDPEGEQIQCSPETAELRRVLGRSDGVRAIVQGGQAAREVGQGWLGKNKLWIGFGLVMAYVVLVRIFGEGDDVP